MCVCVCTTGGRGVSTEEGELFVIAGQMDFGGYGTLCGCFEQVFLFG